MTDPLRETAERIVAEFQARDDTGPACDLFVWLRQAMSAPEKLEPLLPCPFCGGEAHLQSVDGSHWVECASDNCRIEQFKLRDLPDEAIVAWNRRVEGKRP